MSQFDCKARLADRFFRYAAIESQSKAASASVPSTPGQMELAKLLKGDLQELGLCDVKVTDQAIVTAKLPSNLPVGHSAVPAIGFLAHLDTVDISISPVVKPRLVANYDGKDILLNKAQDIWLRVSEHNELLKYIGQDIIVTDGTSVLGADNKAAIASIMVALEMYKANSALQHGDIYVAYVPDEEIGLRGSKAIDLADFPVAFAYTIDSCELGEVVYETFNAGSAVIRIKGITAHPMSAKGVLVNPILIANDIVNHFDRKDTPEHTDGKQGYFWVQRISGSQSSAEVGINIRDFDKTMYEARKTYIADLVKLISARHPRAQISYEISDTYGNIADALTEENKTCIDYIYKAMDNLGITPKTIAMRGGTDGSALSVRGIPTPNFFTGAHNFHSNCEFLPTGSFEKSCQMVLEIAKLICEDKQ